MRAVAAIAVVLCHAGEDLNRFGLGTLTAVDRGAAGVDLFFVISGFVMVYVSEPLFGSPTGALTFLWHRVARIVPLYWAVTWLYVALALLGLGTVYPVETIAASLLFIPIARPDGIVQPVLGQGWTLNYEMLFYAVFGIAVLLPRRLAVALACVLLCCLVVVGSRAALPSILTYWANPIVLEFVFGMLLGLAYREGLRINGLMSAVLIAAGVAFFAGYGSLETAPRLLAWGIPAVLIVAGAVFGCFELRGTAWRMLAVLGDTSYALYLVHTFPLRAVLPLARHSLWLYLPAAILVPCAVAIVAHYTFERPVTRALRRFPGVPQPAAA